MRTKYIFVFALLITVKFFGQELTELDIHSTNLNEIKVVKIFIPDGYKETKHRYPLTLVIDSEILFDSYVASAKLFSRNKAVPQQIILGITHYGESNSSRDYGYNPLNGFPHENSINTLNFIKDELIPMIKDKYRIASFKTVVANKLSANFINYFIFDEKPLFNAYISINPEFAPDLSNYMKKFASDIKGTETFYYLAHGNNTKKEKLDLIDGIDSELMGVSNVYFNYKFESFKHATNLVSIPQSIASAQDYIFSMYSPIGNQEFEKNISYLSPMAAMEYLRYKYENIEYLFGAKIPIRLEDFTYLESFVIDKEEGVHLMEYGELALEFHPKSPLGNYYIGMFYEKAQEYSSALIAYKRGYDKIPETSPKSDGYYINIKRILTLQKLAKNAIDNPVYEIENTQEGLEEELIEDKTIDSTETENI